MNRTFATLLTFALVSAAFGQGPGMKQFKTITGSEYVNVSNSVTALAAESSKRIAADTTLSNSVSEEASARAALGTSLSNAITAVSAYAYSPTNPPPVSGSPNFSTNAYTVTGPQSNLIATALQSEADSIALAALATNRVSALWGGSNFLYRVENGTGKVWRIDNVYGWVRRDTQELTPVPYPLDFMNNQPWIVGGEPPNNYAVYLFDGEAGSWSWGQYGVQNPIEIDLYSEVLEPNHIYLDRTLIALATNLIAVIATTAQLADETSARQTEDSSLNNRVASLEALVPARSTLAPIVNPHVDMLSGDFAVTNAAGFALLATNSPASESVAYATFTQGQTIARLLYANVDGERISGSLPVNHRAARPATSPSGSLWEYAIRVYDGATNMIGSSAAFNPQTTGGTPTNRLATVNMSGWTTNALIVDFVCTLAYSNAYARIYSGPINALNATASFAPLQYATLSELSPAAAAPYTTTNGVTVSWGYWTNGSPATIKSYLGTNYYESLY